MAREHGFSNINMDLIAGLPEDTFDSFRSTMDRVLELSPESVTVHTLSLKRLSDINQSGRMQFVNDADLAGRMLDYSQQMLTGEGYCGFSIERTIQHGELEIVRILRAPGGCPSDREQTHRSLRANFIEETYEAIEAIDTNDLVLLQEELGDVLLQILLHTQMEAEHGGLRLPMLWMELQKKLIVRHPHVFGETVVKDSAEVLSNWDGRNKKQTKDQKTQTQVLRSVSPALPALMRSAKVQKKACKAGGTTASPQTALQAVEQHVQQVCQAVEHPEGNVQKAVGDLLFSVVNITDADIGAGTYAQPCLRPIY